MIIELLPDQVPKLWDAIKYGVVHTGNINEKDRPPYLCCLLHALLSSKANCFVWLDNERNLIAICIVRTMCDNITGKKSLIIESLYSFERSTLSIWREGLKLSIKLAKKRNCTKIIALAADPRVCTIAEKLGFNERYRSFEMEVQDG